MIIIILIITNHHSNIEETKRKNPDKTNYRMNQNIE